VWDGARSGLVGRDCAGALGSTLAALRVHGADLDYVFRFLQSKYDEINSRHKGTGIPHVDPEVFWNLELPLPPTIEEQRRIVAKLDQITARIDEARARLDTIPTTLQRFRQSILAAALSGRLTADWRSQQVALARADTIIAKVKQRILDQAKAPKHKADIEDRYAYAEERCDDDTPQTWRYTALDKLASFTYGTSAKSSKSGDVPVLRMGNLQNGALDWRDLAYTSDAGEIKKYALKPMTVLFNRTNSPELVGKTSIYRGGRPAIFAGYLIRINNEPELLPEYLNYCLNSSDARAWCNQVRTDGVSQSNINAQKLGKFEIPLCSVEEQTEIVRRVEALFKQADAIEARYKKARAFVEKLTPSVLAKAFRGELV
jgi:type I restriction enzyme S subunit